MLVGKIVTIPKSLDILDAMQASDDELALFDGGESMDVVRPSLTIGLSDDFVIGDRFTLGGHTFMIISRTRALCEDAISGDASDADNVVKDWLAKSAPVLDKTKKEMYACLKELGKGRICFREDFAGNWRKGDIRPVCIVTPRNDTHDDILVDHAAAFDADTLFGVADLVEDF